MRNSVDDEFLYELGNRLKDFEENPENQLWEKIAVRIEPVQWQGWAVPMGYAAAIALIAALSISSYMYLNQPDGKVAVAAQEDTSLPQMAASEKPGPRSPSKSNHESGVSNDASAIGVTRSSPSGRIEPTQPTASESGNAELAHEMTSDFIAPPAEVPPMSPHEELRAVLANTPALAASVTIVLPNDSNRVTNETIIPDPIKKKRGLTFYAMITPSLSFQKILPAGNDNVIVTKLRSAPILSSDRFGVAFDAGIQGTISRKLEYYGGFSYYQQNQKLSYQFQSGDSTAVESGTNPLSVALSPATYDRQIEYNMKNVGGQAGVLYQLKGNKLTTKVGAGISFQHGTMKARSYDEYDNASSNYLFYQLMYRNELSLTKSIKIFCQPNFGYALYAQEKSGQPFKVKPYRAGLSFGAMYSL